MVLDQQFYSEQNLEKSMFDPSLSGWSGSPFYNDADPDPKFTSFVKHKKNEFTRSFALTFSLKCKDHLKNLIYEFHSDPDS